jgi:hypothetical protein
MVSLSSLSSPHRGTVPVMIRTMNTVASSTDGEHDEADVEEVRDNEMDGIGPTRKRGAEYSPDLKPAPPLLEAVGKEKQLRTARLFVDAELGGT